MLPATQQRWFSRLYPGPVLIYRPREDERLSWPRWLVIPRWFIRRWPPIQVLTGPDEEYETNAQPLSEATTVNYFTSVYFTLSPMVTVDNHTAAFHADHMCCTSSCLYCFHNIHRITSTTSSIKIQPETVWDIVLINRQTKSKSISHNPFSEIIKESPALKALSTCKMLAEASHCLSDNSEDVMTPVYRAYSTFS